MKFYMFLLKLRSLQSFVLHSAGFFSSASNLLDLTYRELNYCFFF